ncbi:MAG: hypothetical protein JKY65_27160 [Planctomycetes bacterium]|nr:hypothetical protein [Planctomycetota bacterium]
MSRAFVTLILFLTLTGFQPACADEPRRIRQRVDLDFQNTPLAEAIAEIERKTGRMILVDPDLSDRVTIRLRGVNWRQAVTLIAERIGCELRQRGRYLLLTRPKDKISIELYDANVRTALLLLARYADQSIVISPEVTGTITLRLEGVSAARALRAVVKTAGDYVVVAESKGPWRTIHKGARSSASEAEVSEDGARIKEGALDRVLDGTYRGLDRSKQGRPALLLEVREGKTKVKKRLRLAKDPVVRALQVRLLQTLKVGTRIVLGVVRSKSGLTATHLVAPTPPKASPKKASRSKEQRRARRSTPKR